MMYYKHKLETNHYSMHQGKSNAFIWSYLDLCTETKNIQVHIMHLSLNFH